MQINISNLSEGLHTYTLSDDAKSLGLSDNLHGTVTADVTLEKSINQLLLTIEASVKGIFVCDRCVEEFEREVKSTFQTVYSWEQPEEMDETEDDEDREDYYVLRPDQNMIDIAENVRDYLTLAVPLKLECGKKGCAIPDLPHKEEKQSVDPRWAELGKLLKPENN
ncbi:MAG: YceD family protein [Bacteroidota bacterium]